ncbi:DUF732 domain-containing protein [Corynebacterium auriscanis]|uniref:DUF732 domain-containing protein n=1 Tax=Corynebacterium auriscanis TaxID=99807 RepID=UPI000690331E|nr:DUF732 domain-containing protein [Corynebacterium auriscanis]WJY71886.1 hypothetical protein CAURIC_01025 [Corynebacterium auriscanis]
MHVPHQPFGNHLQSVEHASCTVSSTSSRKRRRSFNRGWLVAPLAAALLSGGLVACGSDSTVDNNADSSSTASSVPSVSASASATSSQTSDSDAPSDSNSASPEPEQGGPMTTARDGSVEEIDEVPAGAGRTAEDDDFLNELKNKGIDFDKAGDKNASASLQDQVIAAARASCQEGSDDRIQNYLPMAAGQMQAQGVVDKPEEAAKTIQDAAKKVYCK